MRYIVRREAFRLVAAVLLAVILSLSGPFSSEAAKAYKAPAFAESDYLGDEASFDGDVQVDDSSVEEGYIGFSAMSENPLKVQIIQGDSTYTYDLKSDGTPSIYPLACGDGDY